MNIKRKNIYYVYILQSKDGTYYTGYTNNLDKRIELHNKGRGAKYLRGKLPIELVYYNEYKYYKNALHAERYIKKMSRKRKQELIRNSPCSFPVAKLNAGDRFSAKDGYNR